MAKTNAKEYLMEMAANSNEEWLKALIYAAVETDGNVTDAKLQSIADALTNDSAQNYFVPVLPAQTITDDIKLTLLKHTSGVNALLDNQEIKFSPDITIIHGMNGTGKSSYFRILNKMVGGDVNEEILPNVYSAAPSPVVVKVKYNKGTASKGHDWNGAMDAVPDLASCKVFDSQYLSGLIVKRSVNSIVIEPLGLSLFQKIADYETTIQNLLREKIDAIVQGLPVIDTDKLSEQNKTVFISGQFDAAVKNRISALYSFGDDKKAELEANRKELERLYKFNIETTLKLLTSKKSVLLALKTETEEKYHGLSDLLTEWKDKIQSYATAKRNNDDAIRQFAVLRTLPNTDSPEWRNFINAAEQYKNVVGKDDECPYCHRPYDDKALEIVQTYTRFLSDKSEAELKASERSLVGFSERLSRFTPTIRINADAENALKELALDNEHNLLEGVKAWLEKVEKLYGDFVSCVKEKKELEAVVPGVDSIVLILAGAIAEVDKKIAESNEQNEKLQPSIENLKGKIAVLEEAKSISDNRASIERWFQLLEQVKAIDKKMNKISSRSISTLSTTAHNELITENLATTFQNKLTEIGLGRLGVKVEKAGNSRGKFFTKLVLRNDDSNIQQVLSEGEQKGVGLSMFLAEAELQGGHNPVILDDPVNSLDHEIAKSFAKMLYELDNQVILFNHELLFQSAFESMDHVCPNYDANGCQKQGKHIYIYDTEEFNGGKGLIVPFKKRNAKYYIQEAIRLVAVQPFSDNVDAVTNNLRHAVENMIDEIVFRGQIPTRYTSKNNRIQWEILKKLVNDGVTIDKLQAVHSRVSASGLHNGIEAGHNPLRQDEANGFIRDLKDIFNNYSQPRNRI